MNREQMKDLILAELGPDVADCIDQAMDDVGFESSDNPIDDLAFSSMITKRIEEILES